MVSVLLFQETHGGYGERHGHVLGRAFGLLFVCRFLKGMLKEQLRYIQKRKSLYEQNLFELTREVEKWPEKWEELNSPKSGNCRLGEL